MKLYGREQQQKKLKREAEIIAGAVCADHVHLCVSIPPKLSISDFVGYLILILN